MPESDNGKSLLCKNWGCVGKRENRQSRLREFVLHIALTTQIYDWLPMEVGAVQRGHIVVQGCTESKAFVM